MKETKRRSAVAALLLAAFAVTAGAQAPQDFPKQPIRMVVTFPPGGSADAIVRMLVPRLNDKLGQQVVVDNRPGAGGNIGLSIVAKAPADGYTLGMATVSTHGSNPAVYGSKLRYHPVKDFAPVTNVATTPSVFAVNPNKVQAKDMKEFLALAKANPGKFSFGSPGTGSLGHANIAHFTALAGVELLHVPYKGAGQAMNDAVGGQVDAITDNLPSALPHLQSGKLRALAVLAEKRSPALPDVPTYGELGFPQMGGGGWFGVVAPAGTPAPIVAKLNAAIHKAMQAPEFQKKMADSGAILIPGTPAQFAKDIEQAVARYDRVSKIAKIQAD